MSPLKDNCFDSIVLNTFQENENSIFWYWKIQIYAMEQWVELSLSDFRILLQFS